jgi:tRNA (uracil-5-)-methyltransferase
MKREREEENNNNNNTEEMSTCVCVKNVGKQMSRSKVREMLQKLPINGLVKFDKPYNNTSMYLYFENKESESSALKTLQEHNNKWKVFVVKAREEPTEEQHMKKMKMTLETSGKSIIESVTPLAHLPYEEQLKTKENEVTTMMREQLVVPLIKAYKKKDKVKQLANFTAQKSEDDELPDYLKVKPDENNRGLCFEWRGIEQSPVIDGYRNNCEFTCGYDKEEKPCVGFLMGLFSQGFATTASPFECKHISQTSKDVCNSMQQFVEKTIAKEIEERGGPIVQEESTAETKKPRALYQFDMYDKLQHKGFFRMIKVRENVRGQVMLIIQVNPQEVPKEKFEQFKKDLLEHFLSYDKKNEASKDKPFQIDIVSIFLQQYEGWNNAAPADSPLEKLYGEEFMIEEVLGLKFQVSPFSFFQVNTKGAELLYSIAGEWAQIEDSGQQKQPPILFDVCCGTGTIGMSLAHKAEKVIGLEIVESAVEDAKKNANLNNITNVEFICGKAEDTLGTEIKNKQINKQGVHAIAIVDPPRSGLHNKVLTAILKCRSINRLVYVSCNPKTLAENAVALCRAPSKATDYAVPFKPVKAVAVDMFPHTNHCEMIMLFERNNNNNTTTSTPPQQQQEQQSS